MYRTIVILLIVLLNSCDTRTGNNSPYTIAGYVDTFSDRQRAEGLHVFQSKCAACHNMMKESTGPALSSCGLETRDLAWLQALLSNHRQLKNDKAWKARVKRYGMSCPEQDISPKEVKAIFDYIRNPSNDCFGKPQKSP